MSPSLSIILTAFLQLVLGIGSGRFEQAVAKRSLVMACDHKGLLEKARQAVAGLAELDRWVHNIGSVLQCKAAPEYRQRPQHRLVFGRQKLVAPVKRSPERLMARESSASPAREDREAILK